MSDAGSSQQLALPAPSAETGRKKRSEQQSPHPSDEDGSNPETDEDEESDSDVAVDPMSEEEIIRQLDLLEDEEAAYFAAKAAAAHDPGPLVDQQAFALGMGCVVLMNTVIIGVELESGGASPIFFLVINNCFLLIYLSELFLRFLSRGSAAAKDALTMLDIFLILMSFVERFASGGSLGKSLPSIRLLRLLRLIRTFKAMATSKELMVLMSTSGKSMITLSWTVLLLFTIVWVAAAVTRKVFGDSPVWNGSMNPMVEHEPFSSFDNRQYYGSMGSAFLTNLQIVTNSQWANNVGRPVFLKYPIMGIFFIFYCFSTTFGLVVCVVSNIVQDSLESSRAFENSLEEMSRENRKLAGIRAKRLLQMIDEDRDGELGIEELENALLNEEFIGILRILEVPIMDAEGLIRLFDVDGSGSVSFQELVDGITSMLEDITAKDFTKLSLWSLSLTMKTELLEKRVSRVYDQIKRLKSMLEFALDALEYFMENQRTSGMYYSALKLIRGAPPPVPVDIKTALRIVEKEEAVPEDEFEAVLNFARRFVGPKPPEKKRHNPMSSPHRPHTGLRVAATLVSHKAVLQDAPPSMPDAKRIKSKEEKERRAEDMQYQITSENGFRSSPKFSALKDLLGGT